jgi:hypothetical protein
MTPRKRYRCRACGAELPAWLPVFNAPNGAMLLHHLSARHRDQVKAYLDRMISDDLHDQVIVEAYEVVETPP